MVVYKPTAKGIRNGAFEADERLIVTEANRMIIFNKSGSVTSLGHEYKPDSYITRTNEEVPKLYVDVRSLWENRAVTTALTTDEAYNDRVVKLLNIEFRYITS